MPYILANDGRREALREGDTAKVAGELNYQIFHYVKHNDVKVGTFHIDIIKGFVRNFLGEKPNYQRYNDMTGALIRCYAEVRRRLNIDADYLLEICASYNDEIDKYEDVKIKENGDVE
jgi:hypothetical protein